MTAAGWAIARSVPVSAPDCAHRRTVTLADADTTLIGTSQISYDNETWTDDLAITYRRVT